MTKYIDEMQRVREAHQDKVILDEVTMAFRAARQGRDRLLCKAGGPAVGVECAAATSGRGERRP